MGAALREHGIALAGGDGINLWLPVEDERSAIVQLTASGIRVAPGTPFQPGDPVAASDGGPGGFVRVTVGVVRDEVPAIAAALAAATHA
jgi:hypothetical protein